MPPWYRRCPSNVPLSRHGEMRTITPCVLLPLLSTKWKTEEADRRTHQPCFLRFNVQTPFLLKEAMDPDFLGRHLVTISAMHTARWREVIASRYTVSALSASRAVTSGPLSQQYALVLIKHVCRISLSSSSCA